MHQTQGYFGKLWRQNSSKAGARSGGDPRYFMGGAVPQMLLMLSKAATGGQDYTTGKFEHSGALEPVIS